VKDFIYKFFYLVDIHLLPQNKNKEKTK